MRLPFADAIFWVAVAACSIAQIAIVRSVLISPTGSTSSGRRVGEVAWAILPGVALVGLFFYTWRAMHSPVINAGAVASLLR